MMDLLESVKARPEYFKQLSFKTLLLTHYNCPQETVLHDLYSEQNFIIYILSGRRFFSQQDSSYEMNEGKAFFAKKGGWLSQKEPGTGWCVIVFFMPDSYLRQFYQEYCQDIPSNNLLGDPGRPMHILDINETTRSFFHAMVPYFTQADPPPEAILELKFRELLLNLLVNPANKDFFFQVRSIANHYASSLPEIMEANYTYNFSLSQFAKLSHLSLASFKREFTKAFHTTPGKWLMKKRLNYASQLLRTSLKTVNDIAFESGFENATHFSRVFKENFRVSPLQYRKNFLDVPATF